MNDPGLPEILKQERQKLHAVHEGDTMIYVRLFEACRSIRHQLQRIALEEEVDHWYMVKQITLDQHTSLRNVLEGKEPEEPMSKPPPPLRIEDGNSVYPTAFTQFLKGEQEESA